MREITVLGLLLLALQVVDGTVTGIAVAKFGVSNESNPLAREVMEAFGVTPAIVIVKTLAAICVLYLLWSSRQKQSAPGAAPMVVRGLWLLLGAYLVMCWQWINAFQYFFQI